MRVLARLAIYVVFTISVAGCGGNASLPDAVGQVTRAEGAWAGDWHAVWQVEWAGAPVRGPLVAEVWHAADGRLRIETLEAPTPALSGLTLVSDGHTSWLYDLRQDRLEAGPDDQLRIPLSSDALDAIDWLFSSLDGATLRVYRRDRLESGLATRLDLRLASGDQAALWVDSKTGLPSRVELHSAVWGDGTFIARSISPLERLRPGLFVVPGGGNEGVQ